MSNMWLDIAGTVLDTVDTDCDIFSGGLNAAKSNYEEKSFSWNYNNFIHYMCWKYSCEMFSFLLIERCEGRKHGEFYGWSA